MKMALFALCNSCAERGKIVKCEINEKIGSWGAKILVVSCFELIRMCPKNQESNEMALNGVKYE